MKRVVSSGSFSFCCRRSSASALSWLRPTCRSCSFGRFQFLLFSRCFGARRPSRTPRSEPFFCAKYHMVLFVPIAWVWLIVSGRWRELSFALVPVIVVAGLVFCFPVWYWNMTHDWISFRFQLEHGLKGTNWKPTWPLAYVLGQIAILFPIPFILAMRRREPHGVRWLHAFGWLPLLFFLYTSFRARVEANWPLIAHPAVLALAFFNDSESKRWIRATMCIWALASFLVVSQLVHPWLPIDGSKLKTAEMTKYEALAQEIPNFSPLFASSYQMAAMLSYKSGKMIPKLVGMNRRDFYDFHPMSHPQTEVFYVAAEEGQPLPDWVAQGGAAVRESRTIAPSIRIFEVKKRAQDPGH